MTREEILAEYKVVDGVICSPGKFENQAVYVPHFWEIANDGGADYLSWPDEDTTYLVHIEDEDRKIWLELSADTVAVGMSELGNGFVRCDQLTVKALYEIIEQNRRCWQDLEYEQEQEY